MICVAAPALLALGAAPALSEEMPNAQALYDQAEGLLEEDDDEEGALPLFEASCEAGLAAGCFRAGDLLFMLSETDEEDERARGYLTKGCELGHAEACSEVADIVIDEDEAQGLVLFTRACELEEANSCRVAGFMHQTGRGAEASHATARVYYDRGCNLGNARACYAGGESALADLGSEGIELAKSFYERTLALTPDNGNAKHRMEQIAQGVYN